MKDHYVVLGIARNESPRGVRSAFRDLVREHHPDRAGPSGAPMFREVVEAYRVLSDPERRRAYDAHLRERDPVRVRRAAEPLRARPRRTPFEGVDLFGRPSAVRPSADALLDRILRNFAGPPAGKAEHGEPLFCDIALDADEARRGGVLPIRIPAVLPCPACHGAGHVAGFPCRRCDSTGAAPSELVVPIEIPPGVRPGTILEAPLDRWGIDNLWLRARIGIRR